MAGSLTGGVVGLALLLLISLTINILAMIYCIYQLRVKPKQSVGERGNEEKLYEQVDDQQHTSGVVVMKQNEAYGELSRQISHPSHTTGL